LHIEHKYYVHFIGVRTLRTQDTSDLRQSITLLLDAGIEASACYVSSTSDWLSGAWPRRGSEGQ